MLGWTETFQPMSDYIADLASAANLAANHYRATVDRPAGLSDTIAAGNALARATDELTSAICDVLA